VNEKNQHSDLLGTLLTAVLFCLLLAGYHLFYVFPAATALKDSVRTFYVADLEALSDAKIVAMLRTYREQGVEPDDARVAQEISLFQEKVAQDFAELGGGTPIFQRGTVIYGDISVLDLTQEVARRNGLDLNDSLESYISQ